MNRLKPNCVFTTGAVLTKEGSVTKYSDVRTERGVLLRVGEFATCWTNRRRRPKVPALCIIREISRTELASLAGDAASIDGNAVADMCTIEWCYDRTDAIATFGDKDTLRSVYAGRDCVWMRSTHIQYRFDPSVFEGKVTRDGDHVTIQHDKTRWGGSVISDLMIDNRDCTEFVDTPLPDEPVRSKRKRDDESKQSEKKVKVGEKVKVAEWPEWTRTLTVNGRIWTDVVVMEFVRLKEASRIWKTDVSEYLDPAVYSCEPAPLHKKWVVQRVEAFRQLAAACRDLPVKVVRDRIEVEGMTGAWLV